MKTKKNTTYEVKKENIKYYKMLEVIRRSGVCNMWGASPVLAKMANISEEDAEAILLEWINNYNEIKNLIKEEN